MKFVKLSIILSSILLLSACGLFEAKDNSEPPHALVNFKPTLSVNRLWVKQVGDGDAGDYLRMAPAVVGNRIYAVSSDGSVMALNRASGQVLWQRNLATAISTGVTANKKQLFLASANGQLMSLSANSGKLLWKTNLPNQSLSTPLISGNDVITQSLGGYVVAYQANNGKVDWRYHQDESGVTLRAAPRPAVAGNIVMTGFADGQIVALKRSNGMVLWQQAVAVPHGGASLIQQMVGVNGQPIIRGNKVFVTTYQGNVAAYQLDNGRLIWSHPLSSYQNVALGSQNLFVSSANSHLWALQRSSGATMWQQNQLEARHIGAPAVIGRAVMVADGLGYLHFLSRSDGHFLARNRLASNAIVAPPVVVGNKVYVIDSAGMLGAFQVG